MTKPTKTQNSKTKVKDTLSQFLFNQIESNPEYQKWVRDYQLPTYITDNLSKTLRDYQEVAIKHFIWLFEQDHNQAKHLLFNMATGKDYILSLTTKYYFSKVWT